MRRPTLHLIYAIVIGALIVIPRAILIQNAHSETADDEFHLVRGLEFLHRDAGLVHRELNDAPLGEALAALPLCIMGGTTHGQTEGTAIYDQANYSPRTALMAVAIWKSILFLPMIAIVFIWCRQLYGLASAWLAVLLLLVEPTITGHLHLAALDVVATTTIVSASFLGWRFFQNPTTPRLLAASFACAAALLIKHTAILVPIILCTYALIRRLRFRPIPSQKRTEDRKLMINLSKASLTTLMALWILLAFDISPVRFNRDHAEKTTKPHLLPAGLYIKSLQDAAQHVSEPNNAYLLGQTRLGGWWYYFPVVATYKIPLGFAFIIAMGLLSYFNRRFSPDEWSILVPLVGYTLFLIFQSINIGWRHFLPAYVFLLMLASRCLAPGVTGRIAQWIIVALVGISTTLRWHPDYLAYITWPRADAHQAISDSNLDWGQGLKQAREWIDENEDFIGGRPVHFRGFTTSDRAIRYYLGDRVHKLNPGDVPPTSGILIISPVCLTGISESNNEYAFLKNVRPRNLIGHTLRVYDLDYLNP